MKKLLFNSSLCFLLLSLTFCASNKNNATEGQQTEKSNITQSKTDSVKSSDAKVNTGSELPSQSSDTTGSKQGEHYNKMEIKHNAPNQSEIDSIKKAKTKKKK